MVCPNCGGQAAVESAFCPFCGRKLSEDSTVTQGRTSPGSVPQAQVAPSAPLYQLPRTDRRPCGIAVYPDRVAFTGKFWYLRDKDFYRCKQEREVGYLQNYLGMGRLKKRSYRKLLLFVFGGTALEGIKLVIDKLGEWMDEANDYLQWFDISLSVPDWMNALMNVAAVFCLLMGAALFFSRKNVVEISFTDKRICVPARSLSDGEYRALYACIKNARGK